MATAGDRLQEAMESMALQQTWRRLFAESDVDDAEPLTEAEYLLLAVLSKRGSASALGADVGLERSRVSLMVDRLVRDGLLRRTTDPAARIALTDRGQHAVAQRRTSMARRLDIIASALPSGSAARFAEGARHIAAEFSTSDGATPPPGDGAIEDEPTELTAAERQLFVSALRMADTLRNRVLDDVYPSTGLSTPDFLVLARLRDLPGHRHSGLKSLAATLGWSLSRLSHQVGRMERRDLLRRVPDPESARVTISMTPEAEQVFEKAIALHAASVRRHFVSHVSEEQAEALVSLAEILTRGPELGTPAEEESN